MSSAAVKEKAGDSRPVTPARIVKLYLAGLVAMLLTTLVLGQLNLPYFGKTVWELGVAGNTWLARAIDGYVPTHYPFVAGAIGVLWLNRTYFRARKLRPFKSTRVDLGFGVLAAILLVMYFAQWDIVLPLKANFLYRVSLFCSISVVVFAMTVALGPFNAEVCDVDDDTPAPYAFLVVISCVTGVATGFHGDATKLMSFIGFELPNMLLHLGANFAGFGMGAWFYDEVHKREKGPKTEGSWPWA